MSKASQGLILVTFFNNVVYRLRGLARVEPKESHRAKGGKTGTSHKPSSIIPTPRMALPFISIWFQERKASKRDQRDQRVIDTRIERYWLAWR